MRQRMFWLATAVVCALSFSAYGRVIKVLAVGNSFSEDAVEQYLYELALEGGDTLVIGNAYRGGQGLESHWKVASQDKAAFEYRKMQNGTRTNEKNKTLLHCLKDEEWDYITFQQVSGDSGLEDTYEPFLTYLLDYAKKHATNPQVAYGLHQTWAYAQDSSHKSFANYGKDQQTMYKSIVKAVKRAAKNHKKDIAFVIPSGTAIQNGRSSFVGDHFTRDGYHLSYGLGRYTAACAWLEKITGQNPVGKKFRPSGVDEAEAQVAQQAAHYANKKPGAVISMK